MAAATVNGKYCPATIVCVTGATGFIASWLVKRLLEKGYTVHATVRDPGFIASWLVKRLLEKGYTVHATVRDRENKAKVQHLLEIPGGGEKLKLFRADLLEEGSFDAAIHGCDGVFHVASPIDFAPKDPENDVIKPALEGTLNVLRACTKANTVKRVVVTSSGSTLLVNELKEQSEFIDETHWTDVDFLRAKKPHSWAYPVAKTLAEQAALQYGKENPGLDVVTISPVLVGVPAITPNVPFSVEVTLALLSPVLVGGPAITPNVPFSVEVTLALLTGHQQNIQLLKPLQMMIYGVRLVHVEDVCSAHIFLMENPSAHGRYICCLIITTAIPISTSIEKGGNRSCLITTMPQLADYLCKRYPQYNVTTQFEDMPPVPKVYLSSKKLVESGFSFKFGIDQIFDDGVEYLRAKGLLG